MSAERMLDETFAPINTAPRDGRLILVGHEDVGIMLMRFDRQRTNELFAPGQVGMWLAWDGSSTWMDDPELGPSHWKPYEDRSVVNWPPPSSSPSPACSSCASAAALSATSSATASFARSRCGRDGISIAGCACGAGIPVTHTWRMDQPPAKVNSR